MKDLDDMVRSLGLRGYSFKLFYCSRDEKFTAVFFQDITKAGIRAYSCTENKIEDAVLGAIDKVASNSLSSPQNLRKLLN